MEVLYGYGFKRNIWAGFITLGVTSIELAGSWNLGSSKEWFRFKKTVKEGALVSPNILGTGRGEEPLKETEKLAGM